MTRKAKSYLELNMARHVKGNNKGFFKYINSQRKTRKNVGPLLNGVGLPVMKDTKKKVNEYLLFIFVAKASPQESQILKTKTEWLKKGSFPLVEED